MAPILIDNCKKIQKKGKTIQETLTWSTAPSFSTTKTKPTQIAPKTNTVNFINKFASRLDNSRGKKGLQKSSNTTADMEFKAVDRELDSKLY